jgi:hypothetical protein
MIAVCGEMTDYCQTVDMYAIVQIEMPLSAAEKQRHYRARRNADPVKRAEYLEKERQAWHNKKAKGKVKMIQFQLPYQLYQAQ